MGPERGPGGEETGPLEPPEEKQPAWWPWGGKPGGKGQNRARVIVGARDEGVVGLFRFRENDSKATERQQALAMTRSLLAPMRVEVRPWLQLE